VHPRIFIHILDKSSYMASRSIQNCTWSLSGTHQVDPWWKMRAPKRTAVSVVLGTLGQRRRLLLELVCWNHVQLLEGVVPKHAPNTTALAPWSSATSSCFFDGSSTQVLEARPRIGWVAWDGNSEFMSVGVVGVRRRSREYRGVEQSSWPRIFS
jgi:hypothetical protein